MPPPYRIVYSKAIVARIKEIHELAKELGMEDVFLAALREIDARLSHDPLQFGDRAFTLPFANLNVRFQIVKPLVVYWGVHEKKSLVFLKTLEIWPDRNT